MTYPEPAANTALTFDECEAAGLDGTLRNVVGLRPPLRPEEWAVQYLDDVRKNGPQAIMDVAATDDNDVTIAYEIEECDSGRLIPPIDIDDRRGYYLDLRWNALVTAAEIAVFVCRQEMKGVR